MERLNGALNERKAAASSSMLVDQQALDHSLEAVRRINEACNRRGVSFRVGIYRDVAFYNQEKSWLQYEKVLQEKLNLLGIKSFVIKSQIDNLTASEAKVAWNDPHPSAKATTLISDDILVELTRVKVNGAQPTSPTDPN